MKRNNIKLYDEEKEEEKKKHLKILGSFFKVQTPYNLVSASSVLSSSSLLSCCCNILRSYGMAAFSCFFFFYVYCCCNTQPYIYLHAALFELKKNYYYYCRHGHSFYVYFPIKFYLNLTDK